MKVLFILIGSLSLVWSLAFCSREIRSESIYRTEGPSTCDRLKHQTDEILTSRVAERYNILQDTNTIPVAVRDVQLVTYYAYEMAGIRDWERSRRRIAALSLAGVSMALVLCGIAWPRREQLEGSH